MNAEKYWKGRAENAEAEVIAIKKLADNMAQAIGLRFAREDGKTILDFALLWLEQARDSEYRMRIRAETAEQNEAKAWENGLEDMRLVIEQTLETALKEWPYKIGLARALEIVRTMKPDIVHALKIKEGVEKNGHDTD